MGTISEKLTYLNTTKQRLKDSINALGGDLDNTDTFRSYAEELDNIYSDMPKVTGEGTDVILNGTRKGRLALVPKGNTEQDSYSGKNLFETPESTTSLGITLTKNSDGTFNISGTATGNATFSISQNKTLSNGTYTLSKNLGDTNIRAIIQDYNDNTWLSNLMTIGSTTYPNQSTLNITPQGNRMRCVIQVLENTTVNLQNVEVQLESGSSATEYEQYVGGIPSPNPDYPQDIRVVTGDNSVVVSNSDNTQSQTITLHLGTEYLAGIGDYKDEIIGNTDDWKIRRNVRHLSLAIADMNNQENYPGWKDIPNIVNDLNITETTSINSNFMSNIKPMNNNVIRVGTNSIGFLQTSWYNGLTQTQWKTNYPNLIFELYYGIINQSQVTEISITDTTLITDLNNMYQSMGYDGTTNITITSTSSNAQMTASVSALKGE